MRKLQTFWQNLHLRAKFLLILLVGIVIIGAVYLDSIRSKRR